MPISFPSSPSNGDVFTSGGRTWVFNSASNSWIGGLSMAVGTLAAQNSNAVAITGGTISGLASASISGNLTVDTTTFVVDSVNNRVGIGTALPDSPFHVYSAIANLSAILDASSGDAQVMLKSGGVLRFLFGYEDSDDGFRIYNYGTSSPSLFIKRATGNVGIGTVASTSRLVVKSAGQDTTPFQVWYSTADVAIFKVDQNNPNNGVVSIMTGGGLPVHRWRVSGDSFLCDGSGNLGVGTSTPTAKLDVNGSFNAAGNATIAGALTTQGQVSHPNQQLVDGNSAVIKSHIENLIASYIAGIGRSWVRLGGGLGVAQGSGSASSSSVTGACAATAGNAVNAKAYAAWENGMSWQSGSGAAWVFPEKFMFGGFGSFLLQRYYASATGVTAGSNQFSYWAASAFHVGSRVWSTAFPDGTYVTAVSGTTVTVSQNATETVSGTHYLTICYEGMSRLVLCGYNAAHNCYGYASAFAEERLINSATVPAGATQLTANCLVTATCGWTAGNTYITMTAANSSVVPNQVVSGNGIPAGALVSSVSGTTVNLKDSGGNPLAVSTTVASATVGFIANSINGYYLMGEGVPDNTTFTLEGNTSGSAVKLNLSQPTIGETYINSELFYIRSSANAWDRNNALWVDYFPDPSTGIPSLRLCAMRAGVIYRSPWVLTETGEISAWQQYFNMVVDYDEATLTARLFVTEQADGSGAAKQNGGTPRPTFPVASLTLPEGLAGRSAGMTAAVMACANSKLAPGTSTMLRTNMNRLDYFIGQTYAP